jgi:hypothetical protein
MVWIPLEKMWFGGMVYDIGLPTVILYGKYLLWMVIMVYINHKNIGQEWFYIRYYMLFFWVWWVCSWTIWCDSLYHKSNNLIGLLHLRSSRWTFTAVNEVKNGGFLCGVPPVLIHWWIVHYPDAPGCWNIYQKGIFLGFPCRCAYSSTMGCIWAL